MVKARLKETVGAHYGLGDWLAQRITAVVMALYTLLFLVVLLWHGGMDHAVWTKLFGNGAFRVASFVFVVAVLYHAWVGIRNITMDYLKPIVIRLVVQSIVIALLIAYAGWAIQILWGSR